MIEFDGVFINVKFAKKFVWLCFNSIKNCVLQDAISFIGHEKQLWGGFNQLTVLF